MKEKILVTGGCGFIGTNLVRMLLARGKEIRVLDNLSKGSARNLVGMDVELVQGDIGDLAVVEKSLAGMDAVIHLAAYGSVVESVQDPTENFENNVRGTLTMLIGAKNVGVKRFIFSSTGGALIGDAIPPVDEHSLPKPISPYGSGKLCCEAYLNSFAHSYDINTTILRFANVYGPYSDHKIGAVTAFMKAIMTGKPLHIYGDGNASRDFLYVDDLCQGIILALEAELPPATVLHLASGIETSIKDLAQAIIKAAGKQEHEIIHHPPRRGEVVRNFSSYRRAKERLGFDPRIDLQEGLARTWQWFQERLA